MVNCYTGKNVHVNKVHGKPNQAEKISSLIGSMGGKKTMVFKINKNIFMVFMV